MPDGQWYRRPITGSGYWEVAPYGRGSGHQQARPDEFNVLFDGTHRLEQPYRAQQPDDLWRPPLAVALRDWPGAWSHLLARGSRGMVHPIARALYLDAYGGDRRETPSPFPVDDDDW